MIDEVVLGLLTLFLPFSLTKHSAIFTEVKGFVGINNNQLGSWNSCSLRSQNGTCRVENIFLLALPQNLCSELTWQSTGGCDWAWLFVGSYLKFQGWQLKWWWWTTMRWPNLAERCSDAVGWIRQWRCIQQSTVEACCMKRFECIQLPPNMDSKIGRQSTGNDLDLWSQQSARRDDRRWNGAQLLVS